MNRPTIDSVDPFRTTPALLAVGIILALVVGAGPARASQALHLGSVNDEAERLLQQGAASVSVALASDGDVVWAGAWGHANVWAGTEATTETLYNVGSILKPITATAAMQLVDEGQLGLDTPITAYLGDRLPEDPQGRVPTLRQLLSHTSGIEESTVFLEVWDPGQPVPTLETLARSIRQVRTPGSRYEYSNLGFALVGLLVERTRGQPYGAVVAQRILEPLGIHRRSIVGLEPGLVERLALPYQPGSGGQPLPVPQMRTAVFPAGDAYLSPTDYVRFLLAHLGDGELDGVRILSSEATRQMRSAQLPHYGLGWGLTEVSGRGLIGHGGRVPGYSSYVLGDPDDGTAVVAFANSGDLTRLVRAGLATLRGDVYVPPEDRASIRLDSDLLDGYVGCYEVQPGVVIEVVRRSEQLVARSPGTPDLELRAERKDRFFLAPTDARISFVRGPRGVESLVVDPGPIAERLEVCPAPATGDGE